MKLVLNQIDKTIFLSNKYIFDGANANLVICENKEDLLNQFGIDITKNHKFKKLEEGSSLFLWSLLIKEKHRQKGKGTKLMNKIIKIARKRNYDYVMLIASPFQNTIKINALIDFYKKFGFKVLDNKKKDFIPMILKIK
jgi:ribosomal protein S18 acetylase RimI-like enzyme